MYHVPLAFKCNNEGFENGDGEERSEVSGGGERVLLSCVGEETWNSMQVRAIRAS